MKQAIYRFLINWYQVSDKPLPQWLKNACKQDANLDFEQELGESLTRSLKKDPNVETFASESSMASRVMLQITEEDYQAEQQEPERSWAGVFRGATYVAAACFVAVIAFNVWTGSNSNNFPEVSDMAFTAVDGPTDFAEIGTELLSMQNPLDQELEYMLSDAKGALDFLTTSFVPSSFIKSEEELGDQA